MVTQNEADQYTEASLQEARDLAEAARKSYEDNNNQRAYKLGQAIAHLDAYWLQQLTDEDVEMLDEKFFGFKVWNERRLEWLKEDE